MPDIARKTQSPEAAANRPAHGIPNIDAKPSEVHGRGNWYRIFGLIHMLGSAEDDGPVSRIHY